MLVLLKFFLKIIASIFGIIEVCCQLITTLIMWDSKYIKHQTILDKLWKRDLKK